MILSQDNFEKKMALAVNETEEVIFAYLPPDTGFQKQLAEAMNYSFMVGGKRLRPLLMRECYRLCGGTGKVIEPFMAAIEMIHTYSLVHDDLPAMDNDELRRGKPTTHKAFGEALAILAGDGLLNYAFETALLAFGKTTDEKEREYVIQALQVFARKAGFFGMIGGQTVDVMCEKQKAGVITAEELIFIHEHKTAALIQSAMMCGAILAGASNEEVDRLKEAARLIGIAFQIQDDILDIMGDEQKLGKPIGSDERNEKTTYVSLHQMDKAIADQKKMSLDAIGLLSTFGEKSAFLVEIVNDLITREF